LQSKGDGTKNKRNREKLDDLLEKERDSTQDEVREIVLETKEERGAS
jgi:hypothetical protein